VSVFVNSWENLNGTYKLNGCVEQDGIKINLAIDLNHSIRQIISYRVDARVPGTRLIGRVANADSGVDIQDCRASAGCIGH